MKKTNFKNLTSQDYVCIHNKIHKRTYLNRPSKPEEQDILYRLYSPRVQLLENTKTKSYWLSIEYLSAGSKKITNITCEVEDNILSVTVSIDALNSRGNKRNTMSHLVFDVGKICKDIITEIKSLKKITVFLENKTKIKELGLTDNLSIIKGMTSITDPYEEYPLVPRSGNSGENPIEEAEKES